MLTFFVILKFLTMINVQSGAYSLQDFVIKKTHQNSFCKVHPLIFLPVEVVRYSYCSIAFSGPVPNVDPPM